jgi:hypothetical protein
MATATNNGDAFTSAACAFTASTTEEKFVDARAEVVANNGPPARIKTLLSFYNAKTLENVTILLDTHTPGHRAEDRKKAIEAKITLRGTPITAADFPTIAELAARIKSATPSGAPYEIDADADAAEGTHALYQ